MDFAADDYATINAAVEKERGYRAGLSRVPRVVPPDCKNATAWYEGHSQGWELAPKLEAA